VRNPRLAVYLPLLAALLLVAGSAVAIPPGPPTVVGGRNAAGWATTNAMTDGGHQVVDVGSGTLVATGADGGAVQTVPAGAPTMALQVTVTSTGANACAAIPAGLYQWQCTAAAYASPNVTTVASLDGGSIPSARLWAAGQLSPLTRVDAATDGGPLFCDMSVGGTVSCLVYKSSN
jgi:hypothetical protein